MVLYKEILKIKLAYALMALKASKDKREAKHIQKEDRVEPKLIAMAANVGKYATFNPT